MSVAVLISSAPAISNYDDLISAIADALDRDDLSASQIPLFIAHAERESNRLLRVRPTLSSATATPTSRDVPLPSDFLKAHRIANIADDSRLIPVAIDSLSSYANRTDVTAYAQIGGVPPSIRLSPAPTSLTLDILYFAKIPSLSTNQQSNWLLASHHDAYYFMALAHAEAWLTNDARAQMWRDAADLVLNEIREADAVDRDPRGGALATEFPGFMTGNRAYSLV